MVLTAEANDPKTEKEGLSMGEHNEIDSGDSAADAKAIFALILICVATAVFWVSQQ